MLVAMAGLPGTGKSTLARQLAAELGGVVLDKDVVRIALFPPPVLDYSAGQDDFTMTAIYGAAQLLLTAKPSRPLFLDGRTYRLARQMRDLIAVAESFGVVPRILECVSADDVIRERLRADHARGVHPAGNRTFEHYLALKGTAEPLRVPRLTLDTGTMPFAECVRSSLEYLHRE